MERVSTRHFRSATFAVFSVVNTCIAMGCDPGEFIACDGDFALLCNAESTSYEALECPAGCDSTEGCRSFCEPGAVLGCTNDELETCNAQGTAISRETCAMGCATDGTRCLSFEPTNGLGPSLTAATNEPDVSLPIGTRVDTDLGVVQDGNGTAIPVASRVVPQPGAPAIRVFEAKSFEIRDLVVTGSNAIAFVASGSITITGRVSVRAQRVTAGSGARLTGCNGADSQQFACQCTDNCSVGTGGGGNHEIGGRGGAATTANGGAAVTAFSPLAGGCSGGRQLAENGITLLARGGGGGGAVQVVSGTSIVLTEAGLIDVGGGGGDSTAGGGSGGLVILESPSVSITGPAAGIVGNGGAGGGCGLAGTDGRSDTTHAAGVTCPNYFAGSGGTGSRSPTGGCRAGIDSCNSVCPVIYGGGGGSVGRARIATKSGTFQTTAGPVFSIRTTSSVLSPK